MEGKGPELPAAGNVCQGYSLRPFFENLQIPAETAALEELPGPDDDLLCRQAETVPEEQLRVESRPFQPRPGKVIFPPGEGLYDIPRCRGGR